MKEAVRKVLNEKLGTQISIFYIDYTEKLKSNRESAPMRLKVVLREVGVKADIMKVQKKLKYEYKLWIMDGLTLYRLKLTYLARKAIKAKSIHSMWTFNNRIFIKACEADCPVLIMCPEDIPEIGKADE